MQPVGLHTEDNYASRMMNEAVTELLTYSILRENKISNKHGLIEMLLERDEYREIMGEGNLSISYETAIRNFVFFFLHNDKANENSLNEITEAYFQADFNKFSTHLQTNESEIKRPMLEDLSNEVTKYPENEIEKVLSSIQFFGNKIIKAKQYSKIQKQYVKQLLNAISGKDKSVSIKYIYPEFSEVLSNVWKNELLEKTQLEINMSLPDAFRIPWSSSISHLYKKQDLLDLPYKNYIFWLSLKLQDTKVNSEKLEMDCLEDERMLDFISRDKGSFSISNTIDLLNDNCGCLLDEDEVLELKIRFEDGILMERLRIEKENAEESDKINQGLEYIRNWRDLGKE
jgi:hypothetical protein